MDELNLLKFANETPEILSLLYDLNLLPEVIEARFRGDEKGQKVERRKMFLIIGHFKIYAERIRA